ncbi:cobyric acid synthase [Prolixibacteraceae bacterium JC049]|nr:cobyric acid synthase [Prolixibacteraceae bacterium JC049]
MFVGTGSDVGKSIVNAAFCRIFKNDGYSPAPFKAQNMSLNSYPTPDGLEIGRAQAVQAEACKIPCQVEMNPVLLKPTSNQQSQVVLNGKPVGNQSAKEYFMKDNKQALFQEAVQSYETLAAKYNPMVIEGAGSISEMNLWKKDIVNMRMAMATQSATFLIADIDRGGVFASVYGSIALLPEEQRKLIKGIVINKFRGDISLFEDGKKILEDLTGVPVVAVIPYYTDIYIEDEDSVVLDKKHGTITDNQVNIAVVQLKHLSNFTDFNVLERTPDVNLFYTRNGEDIENADIVIIPGSKNTIADLHYLKQNGLAQSIIRAHKNGKSVYGICGGYQIMGESIEDPDQVEGEIPYIAGLGLLPTQTVLTQEKTTEQRTFSFRNSSVECKGYEIHMGTTTTANNQPVCTTSTGEADGYFLNDKTWGSYMHGIFDNPTIINEILEIIGAEKTAIEDMDSFKDQQYDKLAEHVRNCTDMDYVYRVLQE